MSRSGYDNVVDQWMFIRWRGAVASAMRGSRGQLMLRELLTALDAMPVKKLIIGNLELSGEVCALGALGIARGLDMLEVDPECSEQVAGLFGVATALVAEIEFFNDEVYAARFDNADGKTDRAGYTPEARWALMREWVAKQIKGET